MGSKHVKLLIAHFYFTENKMNYNLFNYFNPFNLLFKPTIFIS